MATAAAAFNLSAALLSTSPLLHTTKSLITRHPPLSPLNFSHVHWPRCSIRKQVEATRKTACKAAKVSVAEESPAPDDGGRGDDGKNWVPVVPLAALPKGERRVIIQDQETILLLWYKDEVFAIENRCPAEGAYTEGLLNAKLTQDGCIVCPTTDSTFDLRTGAVKEWYPKNPALRALTPPLRTLFVYPVKTDAENIYISIRGGIKAARSTEIEFSGKAQLGVTASDVNVDERAMTLARVSMDQVTTGSTLSTSSPPPIESASDVVSKFYDRINSRDLTAVDELIAESCIYEDLIFSQPFVGRKAILEFFNKFTNSISADLQFVIDDISMEDSSAIGVTWHLDWKGRSFPFSKGCSFYRLEVINGRRQIVYGRDSVEPAIKPGELALRAIRGVTWLLQRFPQIADRF